MNINILDITVMILLLSAFVFFIIKLSDKIEQYIDKRVKHYYNSVNSQNHIVIYEGKTDLLISLFTIPFIIAPLFLYFTNIMYKVSKHTFEFSYHNVIELMFALIIIFIVAEPLLSGFKIINTFDLFTDKEYFIYRKFFKYKIKYSDIKHVEHRIIKSKNGSQSIYRLKIYTNNRIINIKYDKMIGINFLSEMLLKFNII